jgi:putative methyltransferase (TIGR04325 family)
MASAKEIVRLIAPPILLKLAMRFRLRRFVEWEYVPEGWAYAREHPEVQGWNVQDILEVYKRKWPKFQAMAQGVGPLGVAHESDLTDNADVHTHNAIMSFAYALALTAHSSDQFSMLDWGGGIGHYYLLARALLPDVTIDYSCKDVPVLAEYGALLFPAQHFYSNDSCLQRSYDFVMASVSLQYSEDWQGILCGLAQATRHYLYIAQLPTVTRARSFVFIQRPYAYGYNTQYLAWCLNEGEFLKHARDVGLNLVRQFVYGYAPPIQGAPEQNQYRGYLFSPVRGAGP